MSLSSPCPNQSNNVSIIRSEINEGCPGDTANVACIEVVEKILRSENAGVEYK
jgi:hypothetical protein